MWPSSTQSGASSRGSLNPSTPIGADEVSGVGGGVLTAALGALLLLLCLAGIWRAGAWGSWVAMRWAWRSFREITWMPLSCAYWLLLINSKLAAV